MKLLVTIPTCQLDFQATHETMCLPENIELYISSYPVSAPTNRNICLLKARELKADYIIMCDDDIAGFFAGWELELIQPLIKNPNCQMVSASLITATGAPAVMMDIKRNLTIPYQKIASKALPSACIAFRADLNIFFDQRYTINNRGAGFEDTDFCYQINKKFTNAIYYINNKVKLIHENESKGQEQIRIFYDYFKKKWGLK
jgi:hypothetical protein